MARDNPWEEARRANDDRYDDIMKLHKRRYNDVMGRISGMGQAGMNDINRQFTGLATNATQDLAGRGLSGTTVAPTVQSGIMRDQGAAIGGLRERLAGLQAQYSSQLLGDQAGFMERRTDEYPPAFVGYGGGGGGGGGYGSGGGGMSYGGYNRNRRLPNRAGGGFI